jgi:hypothetical protein
MKKIKLLLLLAMGLAACSSDEVQKDLLNYVNNELPKIAPLEEDAVGAYDGVAGENYKNDSIMYYTIKQNVIPKYSEFATKLAAVYPSTPEVKAMNDEYIKAANDQLEGFKLICLAIEKQDLEVIKQANKDIDEAKNLLDLWRKDLDEQCKKHGIVFKKTENGKK